ncbi:TauD/TfdA dioxygenase family protein [Caulobacter endophyticus]|uniref:Taurine dioxygenase n=1 Tax=Caulobacter endophyticus TaxID=2172652 RepID=A0A2T9JEY8_9CAUL|nr:TauD/TfdA family dioxygenase [Caulobacter endophyticus]PVM82263.1 taurine dioxygenase [Caulobacter endophyticus]
MNALTPISPGEAPDYAGLTVTPAGPVLGAEISGLDLTRPLEPEIVAAIRAALLRHKVVFFRDQDISHEDHVRFGRYFGDLEGHPVTAHVPGFPEILHIEAADGMKLREAIVPIVRAANKWHTDVTFRPAPSMGGVLRARTLPPSGGDTLFADTASIYADLPQPLKDRLAGLQAEHDILQSYGYRIDEARRQELRAAYPPQAHPVVRTHPETGQPHLFVNKVFTTRILGLPEDEAASLLAELLDRVKAPEYQVRFRWSQNAIVFWDNRATQHYAVLDYWPVERVVERVTIKGDPPYFRA